MAGKVKVAIIGTGVSGIAAAYKLGERFGFANLDLVIFEKDSGIGGTWWQNRYPGVACDVASHWYSLSFAPNPSWSRAFSPGSEIQAYLAGVADKLGITPFVKLNSLVTAAEWQADRCMWRLTVRNTKTGAATEEEAQFVVAGPGALSEAALPDIEGVKSFRGPSWHSAKWDASVDLRGRRVAVIGTGASAIQIVPAIVGTVGRLTVYQRSAPWIVPRRDYAITERMMWWFRTFPFLMWLWRMFIAVLMDIRYFLFIRPLPWLKHLPMIVAKKHLARGTRANPALREALTPDYPIGCKRVVVSDDYYPALCKPNVELVSAGISRVTATGIVDKKGEERQHDVIIYATGFDIVASFARMHIVGEGGRVLIKEWLAAGGPEAYYGTFVAGYPNFAFLMGPNVGLGHSSMIAMIEAQCHLAAGVFHGAVKKGQKAVVVKHEVQQTHNESIQKELSQLVWTGCRSWYNMQGQRNATMWPGTVFRYWLFTRRPKWDHFRVFSS